MCTVIMNFPSKGIVIFKEVINFIISNQIMLIRINKVKIVPYQVNFSVVPS